MSKLADDDPRRRVVCKPKGGDALVSSKFILIYDEPDKERLDAAVDTYLVKTVWHKVLTWKNDMPVDQTYEYQYTVELKKGSDVVDVVGATLEGLTLHMDDHVKVLTSHETTCPVTKSMTLNVPANSTLHLYQRWSTRWKSRCFLPSWKRGRSGWMLVRWAEMVSKGRNAPWSSQARNSFVRLSRWIARSLALPVFILSRGGARRVVGIQWSGLNAAEGLKTR